MILRLAFLTGTLVPPYFDSVEHYRIVKELTTALGASTLLESLPALTSSYYHLGFHFLASFLTFVLHADPIEVILVLGQVILAALPLPIFFLLLRESQSVAAAFFGMLLAGFGWYMPGFAVNWGKYPALAGLLSLEIALSVAYNLSQNGSSRREQIILISLLILGTGISAIFHTRALVIVGVSVLSWFLAGKISILSKNFQYLFLVFSLTGILVFGRLIQQEPLLNLTLDPYLSDSLWVTSMIVALLPFALLRFRRGFYFCALFILCIFAALFIPTGIRLPSFENQTILDRPFVEMTLYLPLSILGGLGLAGLLQSIKIIKAFSENLRRFSWILIVFLLVGFAGLISIERYNFYPSDCCNFVGYDDTVALDWLDKNLLPDAHILIAATQMSVLPTGPSVNLVGTDAGIWIPALTGRKTTFASFDTDFLSSITQEQLCQKQVEYVYVGSTSQKFDLAQLKANPERYESLLLLPKAQLYQVIGCSR